MISKGTQKTIINTYEALRMKTNKTNCRNHLTTKKTIVTHNGFHLTTKKTIVKNNGFHLKTKKTIVNTMVFEQPRKPL